MTKLHDLLKPVVNSKETNLNENKKYFGNIWLWFICLLFIISMVACSRPSTTSDDSDGGGNDGGNQPDLIDLDLQFTEFQINGKDKDESVSLLVGRDLNITIQVTNQSTNDYDGIVTYYQSVDDEITINDNSLSSNNFFLARGGSWEGTFTPTVPDRAGTYYYGACLSFQDQEKVNQVTCTASFQVMVRELDLGLALTGFQVNGKDNSEIVSLLVGKDLKMVVQVTNQGKNEYQGTITLYQSGDNEITTNDSFIKSTDFPLVGGASLNIGITISRINLGTYYCGVCLSFQDQENLTQVACTSAVQVEVRGFLESVYNVDDRDNINLELAGANSVTTAQVGGTTYLFTAGQADNGISMFSVDPNDGTLLNVTNVSDDNTLKLDGADSVTTAQVGGTTYLFTAGNTDDGVSVFSVDPNDGTLLNVTNVSDDNTLKLDGADSVTTAQVGGITYLFVVGVVDDGVSVFSVANDGTLLNVTNVADDNNLELAGAKSVTTAQVGENTYLFTAGFFDHGISVFSVDPNDGTLLNVTNVSDDNTLKLNGARSVTTAEVGGTTYLFVVGTIDDGVSVFSVANDGTLLNVANVADAGNLQLDGASSVTTAKVGGITYLFTAGSWDHGVSVFRVDPNGKLSNVFNFADDGLNGILELNGASSITTAEVGGTTYLFVAGKDDDGVSVFKVNGE